MRPPSQLLEFHEPKEIRLGCYLVNVKMKGYLSNGNQFDGTIRVDWGDETYTETLPQIKLASGDLYQRKYRFAAHTRKSFRPALFESKSTKTVNYTVGPTPSADVPIFHTEQYKYYIRVIDITQGKTRTNACSIKFQLWEFGEWGSFPVWTKVRTVIAKMEWKPAPEGYPSSGDYLEGTLHDYKSNKILGEMSMGWVSEFLRKGILQIDKEAGASTILNNGETGNLLETWQSIGERFKWKIDVDHSIGLISKSGTGPWHDEDLERELNRVRKSWHSGTEWRYHLSIVKSYDYADSDSPPKLFAGNLYEVGSRNFEPVTRIGEQRAGIVVATDWVFDKPVYGSLQGQKIKDVQKLLFRTAVHEFGHHMSLIHNHSDTNLMNVTEDIAEKGTSTNPFPNNIDWEFDAVEKMRLKHGSDLYVRPLGIDFTEIYPSTDPFFQAY